MVSASAAARSMSVRGLTRADSDGVLALEVRHGLRLGFVVRDLLAEIVLAMEVDALAAPVGADGDGGPSVSGMEVDGEAAGGDVVMDPLGFGADLTDLVPIQVEHRVVAVRPLGVDLLLERRGDLHRRTLVAQSPRGLVGVVGLLVVDAGQDEGHAVDPAEAAVGQDGFREVSTGLGAGEGGGHGAAVVGVAGEEDVGFGEAGLGHGTRFRGPAACAAGRARSGVGYREARVDTAAGVTRGAGGPARDAGAGLVRGGLEVGGRVACCHRARTAPRSASARRLPVISWCGVFAGSSV